MKYRDLAATGYQARHSLRFLFLLMLALVSSTVALRVSGDITAQHTKETTQHGEKAAISRDYEEFTARLAQHYADWTTPINHPEKWYVDDALVFD